MTKRTQTLKVSKVGELLDKGIHTWNKYDINSLEKRIKIFYIGDITPSGETEPLKDEEHSVWQYTTKFDKITEERMIEIVEQEMEGYGLGVDNIRIQEVNLITNVSYTEYTFEVLSYGVGFGNQDRGTHSKKGEGFYQKINNFEEAKKYHEIVKEKLNDGSPQSNYRFDSSKHYIDLIKTEDKKEKKVKEVFF